MRLLDFILGKRRRREGPRVRIAVMVNGKRMDIST